MTVKNHQGQRCRAPAEALKDPSDVRQKRRIEQALAKLDARIEALADLVKRKTLSCPNTGRPDVIA